MGTKKDIGTVFKEAMSNYSATPDGVWQNIEAQLKRQRRRKLFIFWFLCFLFLIPSGFVIYEYATPSSEVENIENNIPKSPVKNDDEITSKEIDSLYNDEKNHTDITKVTTTKADLEPSNEGKQIITKKSTINQEDNDDKDVVSLLEKMRFTRSSLVMKPAFMDEIKKDSLNIVDRLPAGISGDEEEFNGNTFMRWSIQPSVSFDQYGAFGRETSNGLTTNQGFYLQYRGTKKTIFRIGYKKLELQYDFQSLNSNNQQKVRYTEIPLEIKYSLDSKHKIRPSIISGVSYLFLQEASILNSETNSIRSNKNDFSRQMFSLNLGLGLEYQFNERLSFHLESIFKYHPYPYTKSVGFYPYNLSVSVGIEYNFKF